jgi:hypothetical protein
MSSNRHIVGVQHRLDASTRDFSSLPRKAAAHMPDRRATSTCLRSLVSVAALFGPALQCLADTPITPIAPGNVQGSLANCRSNNPTSGLYPSERIQAYQNYGSCVDNVKTGFQKWLNNQDALAALPADASASVREAIQPGASTSPPASSTDVATATNQINTATNNAKTGTQQSTNASNFLGFSWGLGAGYAFGEGPRRVTASVVNNIVRVSSDVTDGPRVFFETHYYPEKTTFTSGNFGWGPFVTVEAGASNTSNSNVISGFGLGLMGGWKTDSNSSGGFSLGVGYVWEGNIQTLGDGIVANQPLPKGETQVRYKNQSAGALMIVLSRQFGSTASSNSGSKSTSTTSN